MIFGRNIQETIEESFRFHADLIFYQLCIFQTGHQK